MVTNMIEYDIDHYDHNQKIALMIIISIQLI